MRLVLVSSFLCCVISLFLEVRGESSPQFCLKQEKDKSCTKEDCVRKNQLLCVHGVCLTDGRCECQACWAGPSCNGTRNQHAPVFTNLIYEEYISPDVSTDYPFLYVHASDKDEELCGKPTTPTRCPCSQVQYSFADKENGGNIPFVIDSKTGGVSAAVKDLVPDVYRLKIHARNGDDRDMQGSAEIVVSVIEIYPSDQPSVKLRKLQSTLGQLDVNQSIDITFLPVSDVTIGTLVEGSRVDCELTIVIPEALVVEDIRVEIFTEDGNNTLSVLCEPSLTKGAEIEISNSAQPEIAYNHETGSPFLADTAVFNLGNVSNTNTSTDEQDSRIVITFSVTLKEAISLVPDDRYWVTAGVEYNGEAKLWVGQIGFLLDPGPQYAPQTNGSLESPGDFYKGEVAVFDLELNVYKSVANLTVKASGDSTLTSHLMICKLQLCSTGSGYCLDVSKDIATFQVDVSSQNVYEYTYGFGNIVNGGVANSTVDSRIMMDVVAYLRDDTVPANGSLEVSIDDGTTQTTLTAPVTVKNARPTMLTVGKVLTMNVSTVDGDDHLVPGECVKVRVAVAVPYSTSVKPIAVEFTKNAADSNFELCAVSINHIGNDISCLEHRRESIENAVVYSPTGIQATIDLGGLANTGGASSGNGIDNVIGIDFVVKLVSETATHNTQHQFDASVTYGDVGTPLTASISLTVVTEPASITYPTVPEADSTPINSSFELLYPVNSDIVSPGEYAILSVKPTIQPDSQYKYVVSALVPADMTVLALRVISVGSNIACGLLISDPIPVYSSVGGSGNKDMAELDLGLMYNFARPNDETCDDDAVVIELTVLMGEDTSITEQSVVVSLLVGETQLWIAEGNLTVSPSVAMDAVLPSYNNLSFAQSYTEEVVPSQEGSEVKILHTLTIPANSSLKYVVNYTTDVTWLEITDISVMSVGELLLCTRVGPVTAVNGSHSQGMYATVDLGSVCNIPIGSDLANSSQLVIEVTVICLNDSKVFTGTKGVIAAAVEVSNAQSEAVSQSRDISVFIAGPKSTFKMCCPTTSYYMRPQEIERCNITMLIADPNLKFRLEIDTPYNVTAGMTIQNVEVSYVGRNLQVGSRDPVLSSSGLTTQNNQAVLNFGQIIHTGLYTGNTWLPGDDDIVIQIDIQMAGGLLNSNGTSQSLNADISIGQGDVIWVSYFKVITEREEMDKPIFSVGFSHNNTESTLLLGDKVWYNVNISHTPDSMAEATNMKGHIFLPQYIQFDSMVPDYSLSSNLTTMTHSSDGTGFYFEIPSMCFTDNIVFNIETSIKSNYLYKLNKKWKATTPIEVVFNMPHHDLSTYSEGFYFSEPMDYTTYDFTVPYPYIPAPSDPSSCPSPVALGMEDNTITDCQITASFSPDDSAQGHHARLRGGSAWKTLARAGPFLYDRWLKVDLGKMSVLTGLQTQGGINPAADGDLGEFEILFSLDDTLYTAATPENNKIFDHKKDSPASHDTIVEHILYKPVKTRYVVLNLTAYDYTTASKWYNALRIELLGCPIDAQVANDVCPPETITPLAEAYERGFLVDPETSTLFVCDMVTHGKSGMRKEIHPSVYTIQWKKPDMHCYMMKYTDKNWIGLDSRLRNIIGFLPSTGRLYGILSNSPDSYAAADEPQGSWYLIPKSEYDTAAASEGYVAAVTVPFMSTETFKYSNPDDLANSVYTSSDFKATMSGIYKGAEKVLDWNTCCQPTCAADGGSEGCT
ncbi:uncharacterized protein LOC117306813 isoform X1 [Asterias rubens]|uniref:uncharacterized protein LOC117306813 isoform X1 n=1 Tax=Asterias rubens TaxID=7604 RepID=UPI0014553C2C|nr:uncharacterized protein LOC117306813 isoform X1 [Asterias rubens]